MPLRQRIKDALDCGALAIRTILTLHKPTVFMFHGIGDERVRLFSGELNPVPHSRTLFGQFLAWLGKAARIVPLREALDAASAPTGSKPFAALTFDDGTLDNYTNAYPRLVENHTPATFFIPGVMVDHPAGMSKAMVREVSENGISIGSHTMSHPHLSQIGLEQARAELNDSREFLQDLTGRPCSEFCYPYGDYNSRVRELVREAGYESAVSASEFASSKDRYAYPRCSIPLEFSPLRFRIALHGARGWRGFFRPRTN